MTSIASYCGDEVPKDDAVFRRLESSCPGQPRSIVGGVVVRGVRWFKHTMRRRSSFDVFELMTVVYKVSDSVFR